MDDIKKRDSMPPADYTQYMIDTHCPINHILIKKKGDPEKSDRKYTDIIKDGVVQYQIEFGKFVNSRPLT